MFGIGGGDIGVGFCAVIGVLGVDYGVDVGLGVGFGFGFEFSIILLLCLSLLLLWR